MSPHPLAIQKPSLLRGQLPTAEKLVADLSEAGVLGGDTWPCPTSPEECGP